MPIPLPGLSPQTSVADMVPHRGLDGWGFKSNQPPGSYFAHIHMRETIVILEEGNRPYPRCPKCKFFVSHEALNGRHLAADFCHRGEHRWELPVPHYHEIMVI